MKVGILGGSGLYDFEGLEDVREQVVETPFGSPSAAYVCGTFAGREICFLPRHGKGHTILPFEINYRANIMGFKILGVDRVISVSATGSLKEEHRPRDLVLPDQYYDRTKSSQEHTFFGKGIVAHVSFGEPTCPELRATIERAAKEVTVHRDTRVVSGGTYVNMEGPAFSTKAESNTYRSHGFDVIGMTSVAEAKLCREAEMCYQAMAFITDYDCWREGHDAVTVEMVTGHLMANTSLAKEVLKIVLGAIPEERSVCGCGSALATAIITQPDIMPEETRTALMPILSPYL